jgi:subtilisin family serine protease
LLSAGVAGLGAPLALGYDPNQPEGAAPGPTVRAVNTPAVRYVPGKLVVGLSEGASKAKVSRLFARAGAKVRRSVAKIDARVLEVPEARVEKTIASLLESSTVEYVEREVWLERTVTIPNDPLWNGQWGPLLVRGPAAWDATKGNPGVVIAVLDTGVDVHHPDLQGSFVAGFDVIGNDADADDDHGHGSAAAGVIAARGHNGEGLAGVCWSCSVMPVKVLDGNGSGTSSAVAAGIVWAADHGARVISMSLGGVGTTQALANAVAYAAGKGAVLVAAAGNSGTTTRFYPAAYPEVIGVAGTTSSDKLYDWSNRGDWVQVAAPGCNTAPRLGGGYENFCGTSSATPLVAGIAGLALSLAPNLNKGMFEQALRSSAVPLPGAVRYGRVDALGTLVALQLAPPVNLTRPRVTGVLRSGQPLQAENGQWAGAPASFAYAWQRCTRAGKKCSNIAGATAQRYVLTSADVGRKLRVVVRAVNVNGEASAVSKPTGIVRKGARGAHAAPQAAPPIPDSPTGGAGPSAPTGGQGGQTRPCAECSPPAPTLTDTLGSQVDSTVAQATETAGEILDDPPAQTP